MIRSAHVLPFSRTLIMAAALAVFGTACITPYDPTRTTAVEEPAGNRIFEEKIRRLEGDTETALLQLNDLRRDLERAQHHTTGAVDARLDVMTKNLEVLQQRMAALESAREKDKQEIVDRLSAKIAGLISQQQSAASSSPVRTSPRRASEYGYEHVVESGQTLSAIAHAYGVSTRAIIEANSLSNPNQLRVGQKLFIPE